MDECSHREDDCEANSNCINTIGSYRCECKLGYLQLLSDGIGARCQDIDECVTNPCSYPTVCRNTVGSYICECEKGLCLKALTLTLEKFNDFDIWCASSLPPLAKRQEILDR